MAGVCRRDVVGGEAALAEVLGSARHTRLTADQGPQARYTAYLKVLRGHAQVVVGTRAAALAPVRDLGLLAWWDDGDDLLDEPRAPYPHVREVVLARAAVEGAGVLAAGFARSVAVAELVERLVLTRVEAPRAAVRRAVPAVHVAGEGHDPDRDPAVAAAHLPSVAWRTAKEALVAGPVLVQVPRRGYLPALSCQDCRRPARCPVCAGPLGLPGPQGPPACRWCGRVETAFTCPFCAGTRLRSSVVGARRTAEELGRAFPGVPVERSGAGTVLEAVPAGPRLVVSTPGAEPVAPEGYAAALLLDAWALLERPSLTAGGEALPRWVAPAALVPPADGPRSRPQRPSCTCPTRPRCWVPCPTALTASGGRSSRCRRPMASLWRASWRRCGRVPPHARTRIRSPFGWTRRIRARDRVHLESRGERHPHPRLRRPRAARPRPPSRGHADRPGGRPGRRPAPRRPVHPPRERDLEALTAARRPGQA